VDLGLVENAQEVAAAALGERDRLEDARHVGKGHAAEIRHAQDTLLVMGVFLGPVKRHDVRVLQSSKREVFRASTGSDFQDDRAVAQKGLRGEIDSALAPLAQFRQDLKIAELVRHRAADLQAHLPFKEALTFDQRLDLRLPRREATDVMVRRRFLAGFLPQAHFLGDEAEDDLTLPDQVRIRGQGFVRHERLSLSPRLRHRFDQRADARIGAGKGRRRIHDARGRKTGLVAGTAVPAAPVGRAVGRQMVR
jgi:hypothetical protein